MGSFAEESVQKIKEQVGKDEVILGLSGGVDSSVAAALIHKAIGDQLTCVFATTAFCVCMNANKLKKLSARIWE